MPKPNRSFIYKKRPDKRFATAVASYLNQDPDIPDVVLQSGLDDKKITAPGTYMILTQVDGALSAPIIYWFEVLTRTELFISAELFISGP